MVVRGVTVKRVEDAMEEIDIRWQVAMITARIRKFMRKTGRPIDLKPKNGITFDKSKIECFNCQKLGHFARECRFAKYQENRANGRNEKKIVAIEDSNSKALVATDNNEEVDWTKEFDDEPVTFAMMALTELEEDDWSMEIDAEPVHFGQDGLGYFDWSNKDDDTPVSLALMATNSEVPYCSKCSKSYKQLLKNYQTERDNFQKARSEILGYQMSLESLEVILKTHEKNEYAWGDKYEQMEYDLKLRDLKLEEKQKELDQVLKERDDFKVKLEKWTNAAVLQNEVLNKQRYLSDKSCIGFGVESSSSKESDNSSGNTNSTESLYPNFQKAKGFHAVPPPTGTIIPPRANVSFTGIDELAIRNKVVNQENTKSSQPEIDRNKVIIEDWVDSDDEETALNFSEIQKKTVLNSENSETSFENRSPNSQNSVGQGSRKKGLGHKGGKTCFVCYSPDHLIKDCNLHERTFKQTQTHKPKGTQGSRDTRPVWNNINRVNHSNFSGNSRPRVPQAVLSQSTGRPYYPRMDNIRPRTSSFSPSTRSSTTRTPHRPQRPKKIMKSIWVKKESTVGSQAVLPQNVSVKGSAMINPTQTWRPKGAYLDSVNRDNGSYTLKQFEYGNPEEDLKDYAIIDSGCSGSMTGDKDKLSDFKEFKGGYVAFGNDPKGGRITGKGTIKTSCIDFEKVSYVEELKFNLLSVSQICDKKHNVLFTDKECLILSPKFKFVDEDLVILRAPRKNDVYSLDLKNIIPSGGVTCLVAKATKDEAVLWHRRLGHVNFKNINKLVKGNLVRGLPSKTFKLDHSCLACRKGKQHRASCKKIEERTVREPLELLHMDLFGPVSVESVNRKKYCLVVTDDCSKFSWVFFLAYKDETYDMLHDLIVGLENKLRHKVKTIRCDHGTEFKNHLMNEFCAKKGIKREYSIARTPQQNGVEERKNRTLIEAARTMLADLLLPIQFWAEVVHTACYVLNRVLVTKTTNEDSFELKIEEDNWSMNQKGKGPDWMFDLDILSPSLNYIPVRKENQVDTAVKQSNSVDFEDVDDQKFDWTIEDQDLSEGLKYCASRDHCSYHMEIKKNPKKLQSIASLNVGLKQCKKTVRSCYRMYWVLCDLPDGKQSYCDSNGSSETKEMKELPDIEAIRLFFAFASFMDSLFIKWMSKVLFVWQYHWKGLCHQTFRRGAIDKTLFIKRDRKDIMLVQVYVDDIIFGSTKTSMVKEFEELMQKEFTMSSMGELTFFLGLQDSPFHLEAFSDSDYAGDNHDRRSTSGGCQYLGRRLVSWQCKKQTIVAISSTEAEYVAAASCCGQRNADFHDVIDFLTGCCVNYALLVSPDVIQQFWSTAKVCMINDVAHIAAKVDGQKILVSEASVRTDLLFHDEDGTHCFDNQVIWDTLRDIGYEGSLTLLSFSKPLFSPQWKYLVHTLLHSLSSKSSSWDQFGTNIASAMVGLATNQKFNFSKLIFDGMLRNLKDSKPFLMYPRFIQLFLNKQLEGIPKPQNFLPTVVLPSKVFTFMSKSSPKFSGKLTPLTPHMLEVANAVRAEHSLHTEELDIPTSSHHSDDSSASEKAKSSSPVASERPTSPNDYTPTDEVQTSGGDEGNLDLYGLTREVLRLKKQNTKQAAQILRLKTKIKILVKQVKPLIAEYRSFVKINATLSKKKKLKKAHKKKSSSFKQGRKKVSDGSTGLNEVDVNSGDSQVNEGTAQVFEGTAEVIEGTEEVHEGTEEVHEGTAQVHESTAKVHESTAKVNEGTAEVNEGTAEVIKGTDEGNESTAGANLRTEPSMKEVEDEAGPSTFQDESDEFIQDDTLIADFLVNISKNRRGAGITIPGNIPKQERPKSPTPTLDAKDKGKGIMKEEPKKKKLTLQQLRAAKTANDEEFARRVAAEWEEEEERKRLVGLERLQAELEDNEIIAAEVQRTERENFTEE
ncbi:putative ribonuclease H-like domain-containing protein, partial [Tanacetum coccineum]